MKYKKLIKKLTTLGLVLSWLLTGWPGLPYLFNPPKIKEVEAAVPSGVIVAWPSTAGTIPSGWSRVTALDAKYVKGTADSTDPGGTGGALTHSHTTTGHTHTGGTHTHTVPDSGAASGASNRDSGSLHIPDSHTHTSNPNTTNPTASLTSDSPSTGTDNHEPPYFTVIYIQSNGTPTGIPDDAIALWSDDTAAPTDWNLADGTSGRPDMRNTFMKGAATSGDGGSSAGNSTHTHTIASHTHGDNFSHDHPSVTSSAPAQSAAGGNVSGAAASLATSTHTHSLTIGTQATAAITGNTDTAQSANHEPPYTAEAFIQNNKGSDNLPTGIIAMWTGTLASIPSGWTLADGTSGTPDLRSQFVKGANTLGNIGDTGGSLTHTHTATGHTHSIASHTHTVTASQTTAVSNGTAGSDGNISSATHTHTLSGTGSSSGTSGTGTPTVNNYTDTQPPFYTVAYIMYTGSSGSTISGTIYQTNESSAYDCSSGGPYTVYLRVNGSGTYSTTCTASSGAWEVTGVTVSSGQTIYAYIYGETPKGSTVLVSDGTTQTNVPIYVDRVTLRDDVNGSITNSEISTGNTSDSDDLISFSGSDITVGSSYEMHIYTGDTYAPGANVSTGKLHVVGSYSGSTETLTLTGSGTSTSRPLYVNGGTFTAPSTTVFQGTSATDIESTTFNALSFTPTITSGITYTFLGAETINGNLTINPTASSTYALTVNLGGTTTVGSGYTTTISGTTSGTSTLNTVSGSNHALSTGLLNIATAGTLTANNSTISLTGTSGTLFTRVGTFTSGGSTVSVTSASGTPTLNSGSISFYNLTINPSNLTISTSTDDITVTNTLNVASGDTLSLASGQDLTHSGTTLTLDGTISGSGNYIYSGNGTLPTGGTLSTPLPLDATNNAQTIVNRTYSGAVELYSNSGTSDRTFALGTGSSQTVTFNGNVTLNAANINAVTLSGATQNPTVNISGNLIGTSGGGNENITTGTGTWTVGGNVDLTNIGTFTATGGTFQMNGTSKTLTSASEIFNNFAITGGSISNTDTMDVNGTFAVSGGATFTHGAGTNIDISIAGDFTLASGTTWTENTDSTSQVIFDGDLDYADNNSTKQSIGNVVIGTSPETTNLTTDFSATSLTVASGDYFNTCEYEVDIGTSGITINGTLDSSASGNAGSVDPCSAGNEGNETTINDAGSFTIASGGEFVADSSTLIMDDPSGTSDLITAGTGSLYNLTISTGGAIIEVEDPLTVTNNLTISAGTLDVVSGENNQINVGGNWDNDATFEARSGTVVFDASSGTKTIDADGTGTDAFYNVTFSNGGSGPTYQLTTSADINNDITISGGTLDANGQAISVQGSWNNSGGTFTANSNTVTFDDTDGGETLAGTMIGTSSFYNLTFNDGSNSGAWSFGNNSATVTNTITISGGTVTAPGSGYTLTIGNDFTNNDGFTHNSGTIVFNNNAQTSTLTYSAATTFNNFTVSTGGKAMQFDNDAQTNIAGLFNIQGTDCTTNRVFLDSDVNDSAWEIYVSGTYDIDYADIEDSTAVTAALTAENSTEDNGGNTNWTVNAGVCTGGSEIQPNIRGDVNIRGGTRIK